MDFVVIDFETANSSYNSICQIGVAFFSGGTLTNTVDWLVNPEDYFDRFNIKIHGISPIDVADAPTFPSLYPKLITCLEGHIVVSHTAYDRVSLRAACEKYSLPQIQSTWLDSARIARRAWPDKYARSGYGLGSVCRDLGIEFNHHHAVEDAIAAGQVVLRAIDETNLSLQEWLMRVERPIDGASTITREGNPDGELFGEVLVFTGALTMLRREAADLAAQSGCTVASNVTKKTTILVVGDQDVARLAGHKKSSKHRKAEKLIDKGQPIRIVKESDFVRIVSL